MNNHMKESIINEVNRNVERIMSTDEVDSAQIMLAANLGARIALDLAG